MRIETIGLVVCTGLFVALSGCAAMPSKANQAKIAKFQQTIPTCNSDAECKAMWDAAQLWIVHNAGYKLQNVTDVLLQTYSPGPYDTDLAVEVTKEPQGHGIYQIVVRAWCNNLFGCTPNALDAELDFNVKVGAAKP
ncbi:MAG: hypothetical protein KGO02_17525 [Alphaproteobacteria bacterium]|nr:hypothetical protein [Alphaproteobacteria bacterium]